MMKKLAAVLLALTLTVSLCAGAWAAETTNQHGTESSSNTITIKKEIVLFNTDGKKIYEPNVTYTYALTAGEPGTATITDDPAVTKYDGDANKSVTVQVKAGTGGVTLTGAPAGENGANTKGVGGGNVSVVFGDGAHNVPASYGFDTNTEGTTVTKDSMKTDRILTITIDPTDDSFTKTVDGVKNFVPGVYRYHIAETGKNANENGVKTPEGRLTDLTLDVYLRWNEARTGLEVYGYVLFRGLTENEDLSYSSSGASTAKVTGFDIESNLVTDATGTTTSTADEYHTFNTTVSKAVSGSLADKNNAWPFEVKVTGISSTEFYYTLKGVPDSRSKTASPQTMGSGVTISETLKDGESITIYGLPYNATVKATETNNTPDFYVPSATYTAGSTSAADITSDLTITDSFQPSKTAATPVYNNGKAADARTLADVLTEDIIAFTNTLSEISPTGVVLRVAPYVLILGAGIALLLISRRRKPTAKEE